MWFSVARAKGCASAAGTSVARRASGEGSVLTTAMHLTALLKSGKLLCQPVLNLRPGRLASGTEAMESFECSVRSTFGASRILNRYSTWVGAYDIELDLKELQLFRIQEAPISHWLDTC